MPRKSVTYVCKESDKPIKKDSDKRVVYDKLRAMGEFTKAEAMEAMAELQPETNSIQEPKTFARAWWNEFANKFHLVVDKDDLEEQA